MVKDEYHLLIEPKIVSKNKRVLLIFKPKELIENSVYELKFKITNKGGNCFPGGIMKNIAAINMKEGIDSQLDEKKIPNIPSQENRVISMGETLAYASGFLTYECKVISDDNKKIVYYQKNKLEDKSEILPGKRWFDFISVTSKSEINQRYTNYILSAMTGILVVFTLILAMKPS